MCNSSGAGLVVTAAAGGTYDATWIGDVDSNLNIVSMAGYTSGVDFRATVTGVVSNGANVPVTSFTLVP